MRTEETVRTPPLTLSDALRIRFKGLLDGVAGFLNRLGLMPNTVTLAALLGNLVAGVMLGYGWFLGGGLLVLVMGALDSIDGSMARLRGERSDFGAFADSVSDRYSELAIFGGLLAYYLNRGDDLMVLATFLATAGSVLVPYVRARAESVGFHAARRIDGPLRALSGAGSDPDPRCAVAGHRADRAAGEPDRRPAHLLRPPTGARPRCLTRMGSTSARCTSATTG